MKRYVEHEPQWKRVTATDGRGDSICIHERETGHGDCNVSADFETNGAYGTRNPHSCFLYTVPGGRWL